MSLIRTQFYLVDNQYGILKNYTRLVGRTISELIRQGIMRRTKRQAKLEKKDGLLKLCGLGRSGFKDLSINHDYYLYGGK